MNKAQYEIIDFQGRVIAIFMELELACDFMEKLCETYYEEAKAGFTLKAVNVDG